MKAHPVCPQRKKVPACPPARKNRLLTIEPLEQRIAPATFIVTTAADLGNGSLRDAITRANTAPGADRIEFNIPGGGLQTISLQSPLPAITEGVTIDGYTQPGASANTLAVGNNAVLQIALNGNNLTGDGLRITGGNSTIRGLTIHSFGAGGQGIELVGAGGNTIEGCFIGTDATGTLDLGNAGGGILINSSSANQIGGLLPATRNVISGNNGAGIEINGGSLSGNVFVNNYIGTNAAGTAAIPNTTGVLVGGTPSILNTRIGGTLVGERNVISGNTTGIQTNASSPVAGLLIQGNFIGTDATGSAAVPNNVGILLNGGSGIVVGGDDDDDGTADNLVRSRNVISGNTTHGISLSAPDEALRIQGNYIGTNAAGNAALGNGQNGILTNTGSGTYLIGGDTGGAGNVISGNGAHGISIANSGGKRVQGNLIGTDAAGKFAIENTQDGIRLAAGGNSIGGSTAEARNIISGNKSDGIEIISGDSNTIIGNYIGTQVDGILPLPNQDHGIFTSGDANSSTIGGSLPGEGNTIAHNGADGVYVSAGSGNSIRGNSIFANAGLGIDLGTNGVTPNDTNDTDTGANGLQNYPVLTGVTRGAASSVVNGTFQGAPGETFTIDLYASPTADPSGSGEGRVYLGSTTATTDTSGNAIFLFAASGQIATGTVVSATATAANGNTSELSTALLVGGEFIWDGGGGADTSWFNPLNWNRDSGVPGADDIATLNINAVVTINSDVQVGALNQSAGTITGTAVLDVLESFVWSGGTQAGSGITRIQEGATRTDPGATLEISGGAGKTLNQRTLSVLGTALVTGTGTVTLSNGAVISNDGLFELQSDADFFYPNDGSTAVQFTNLSGGTLRKTTSSGMTEFGGSGISFNNSGIVEVETGTIRIIGSGGSGLGSFFSVSPGAVLEFGGGTFNIPGVFNDETAVILTGGGTVVVSGATVNLGDSIVVENEGTVLRLLSGTLNVNGTMEVGKNTSLEQSGGTLGGTGTLAISGAYQWSGGTQADSGATLIANTGTLAISGSTLKTIDQRTLETTGIATLTGDGTVVLSNAATINNSGIFDLQSDADFSFPNNGSAAVAFNNLAAGVLRKSAGTGATEFNNGSLSFNNSGLVDVLVGSLRFTGSGGTHTNSTFRVASGAQLEFANGNHVLHGGTSFEGGGRVIVSGGGLSVSITPASGPIFVPDALAPVAFIPLPGVAVVASGTELLQTGGTISGGGTLSIAGRFEWSGGTMEGNSGITRIESGATLEINGAPGKTLTQRTIEVLGTARMTGSGTVNMSNGAAILNSGLFELQSDGDFLYPNDGSAPVQFTNQGGGTLRKLSSTGMTEFGGSSLQFNNSGLVEVQSGTIRLGGSGGSGTGSIFRVSPGAVFEFGTGTYNLTPNGSATVELSGGGVIAFRATVNFGDTIVSGTGTQLQLLGGGLNVTTTLALPAGTRLEQSGGTLGGAGTLTVAGTYQWNGGTQAGSGVTQIASTGTFLIGGSGFKNLNQRTLDIRGSTTVTGDGNLVLNNGAVINNSGIFNLLSDADFNFPNDGSASVAFNNLASGVLLKSGGTAATEFNNGSLSFNNSGSIDVLVGALRFTGSGGTHTGSIFRVGSGAQLEFGGGTHSFSGTTSFEGSGQVIVTGAATLGLGAGSTATVQIGTKLVQSGGTINGTGTLSIAGNFEWSGGTQASAGVTRIQSGAFLDIFAGVLTKTLTQRTLEVLGTARVSGTGTVIMGNGATISNSGLFELQSDADFLYPNDGSAAVQFNNQATGTLRKLIATGVTEFGGNSFNFQNAGLVDLQRGTVLFSNGYTQSGGQLTLNGGNIGGGATLNLQGGELTGAGTITGSVNNSGATIRPGGTGQAGTLTITGNYTQGPGATLAAEFGGTTAGTFDVLAVSGTATLGGTLNIANLGAFVPLRGDQFRVVTSSNNPGTFTNFTGQVSGLEQLADASGLVVRPIPAPGNPDLVITATDSRTETTPGSPLIYTLAYRNDGTLDSTGVRITETLPAGTSFNAAASTPGWVESTSAPGVYTFLVGSANVGATGSVAFAVNVNSAVPAGLNSISNTATISDDGRSGADLNPADNTATDTTAINAAPDLVINTSDGASATTPGSVLSYTLNYGNQGNQGATGVVLTQTLPTGTTFNAGASTAGWTETAAGSGVYTLNVGSLAGGANGIATFAVTVTSPATAGRDQINSTVSIADDLANGADLTPGNNITSDTTALTAAPDLVVTTTNAVPITMPGLLAGYTLNYRNQGNQDATGVVLTQTLPAGTTFNAGVSTAGWTETVPGSGVYTLNVGSLAGGANGSASFVVTVDPVVPAGQDTVVSSTTISDDGTNGTDLAPGDNTSTATITLNAAPDLIVTASSGVSSTTPGSLLSYTLNYRNQGSQDATGVVLTQTLPAGTTFNAGASTAGWIETSAGSGVYTLNVGSLAGSTNGTATFAVTITSPAIAGRDQINSAISIADDLANGADLIPNNNSTTASTTLDASPDLQVLITSSTEVARRGGSVSYNLSYSNVGNQNATGVFLTQALPANTSFNAAASSAGWEETAPGSRIYRLDVGALSASAQGTAVFTVQCATSLPGGFNELSSIVSISDDQANGADPNSGNNSAQQTTHLYQGVYILAPGVPVRLRDAAPATVRVFNIATGTEAFRFDAYEANYRDSVRLAVGDINGDGFDDIITAKRTGTGQIRVFDGLTGTRLSGAFNQIDPFSGRGPATRGAFVASGDVTGDGRDDIIVGSALGGGQVKIYDGVSGSLVTSYQPFGRTFKGGVRVAVGDVDGDGVDDVITGQGSAGSRVKVFDGATGTVLQNFRVAPRTYTGGVFVASGDFDGDGRADIVTGRDIGSAPLVQIFSGQDHHRISAILAFNSKFRNGVRVAAADVNLDGIADIIATSGTGNQSRVRVFDGSTKEMVLSFAAFPDHPNSSLFVASSTTVPISLPPSD